MDMEVGDVQRNQDRGNIGVVKAPLHKILQNPLHVDRSRDVIRIVNTIVTAANLFIRYVFVNEYDDNDAFNVNEYITPAFFKECLKALQTQTQARTQNEDTIRYRRLISRHIEEFCVIYRYHLIRLEGNQSNWESYIATQMCTAYDINNAEQHTGRHLLSLINVIFNTKELNRLVLRQNATATEKRLACAYLADITSFKDIISNANFYNEVQNRTD